MTQIKFWTIYKKFAVNACKFQGHQTRSGNIRINGITVLLKKAAVFDRLDAIFRNRKINQTTGLTYNNSDETNMPYHSIAVDDNGKVNVENKCHWMDLYFGG